MGLPLSVCIELQDDQLQLENVQWTLMTLKLWSLYTPVSVSTHWRQSKPQSERFQNLKKKNSWQNSARKRRRANRHAGAGQDKDKVGAKTVDAVEPAPGVTPNIAHLPAESSEAKQHRKAGGEECNNKRDVRSFE